MNTKTFVSVTYKDYKESRKSRKVIVKKDQLFILKLLYSFYILLLLSLTSPIKFAFEFEF